MRYTLPISMTFKGQRSGVGFGCSFPRGKGHEPDQFCRFRLCNRAQSDAARDFSHRRELDGVMGRDPGSWEADLFQSE